jgi:hypothetical protein
MTTTGNTATRPSTFPPSQFTDHMVERGYTYRGEVGPYGGELLELFAGNGSVRVVTYAEDRASDAHADIHVMNACEVLRYSITHTPGTPPAVMLAALIAAETEAAAYRGDHPAR